MLSLSDDLRRFENVALDNDLDSIITIEQNFSNGTVSVKDLVRENHTILTEFKRMKNVFINYTKLNQKIHDKITQHQLSFGSTILKLGNLTNFFEKTIDGTLDKMKLIYQDTLHQNKVSENKLESSLAPFKQQLRNKVDINQFNQAIKALNGSSEHDSAEMLRPQTLSSRVQQHLAYQRQQVLLQTPTVSRPNSRVSGKKISEEEINNIKTQVLEQLATLNQAQQQSMEQVFKKIEEARVGSLKAVQDAYRNACSKITQLEHTTTVENTKLSAGLKLLSQNLEAKTHQKVWEAHRSQTLQEVQLKLAPINANITQLHNQSIANMQGLSDSIHTLSQTLTKQIDSTQRHLQEEIKELSARQSRNTALLKQNHQQLAVSLKEFKQLSYRTNQQTTKLIDKHKQQADSSTLDIHDKIDRLSLTLESTVLKMVVKRFQQTINDLVSQMRELKKTAQQTSKRVSVAFENIHDIKEVTGRKANYTDIVGLFEKKASKEEVTVLKELLSSTEMNPRKDAAMSSSVKRDTGRMKSSIVRTSKHMSPDRSLQTSLILGGFTYDKQKTQAKFLSKRFQFRPHTAEHSIFD